MGQLRDCGEFTAGENICCQISKQVSIIAGLLGLWMAVGGIFEGAGMQFLIGKPWLKRKC